MVWHFNKKSSANVISDAREHTYMELFDRPLASIRASYLRLRIKYFNVLILNLESKLKNLEFKPVFSSQVLSAWIVG